ncbi:MAG: hypothetical protein LBN32_00365 [Helicobacteraceae bacterium]|jgi:hypothetical protein|nr:hypothetical protein [Helicobacteraceae bacterium]
MTGVEFADQIRRKLVDEQDASLAFVHSDADILDAINSALMELARELWLWKEIYIYDQIPEGIYALPERFIKPIKLELNGVYLPFNSADAIAQIDGFHLIIDPHRLTHEWGHHHNRRDHRKPRHHHHHKPRKIKLHYYCYEEIVSLDEYLPFTAGIDDLVLSHCLMSLNERLRSNDALKRAQFWRLRYAQELDSARVKVRTAFAPRKLRVPFINC